MISWTVATIGIGIVLYIAFVFAVSNNYISLPNSLKLFGSGNLLIMYRTQKGLSYIETIAKKSPKGWKYFGNLGVIIGLFIMLIGLIFVVSSAIISLINPPEETISSPANFLIIPGVNDFLPLSVAGEIFIGFVIALVVHEGGHAILCRVEDIKIDSTGLLFLGPLPLGAFVEPDMDDQENASRTARLRMFVAGIMNNLVITGICIGGLILLGFLIVPQIGATVGIVSQGTPIADSGIEEGDVITQFDDQEVNSNQELNEILERNTQQEVSVVTNKGESYTINRSLIVNQRVESDFSEGLSLKDRISSINEEEVNTIAEFINIVGESEDLSISLETEDSSNVDFYLGALVTVQEDSPFIDANEELEPGDNIIITSVGDERIKNQSDFQSVEKELNTSVKYYTEPNGALYGTTLNQEEIDNLVMYQGYSGVQFTDTGLSLYPVDTLSTLISPLEDGFSNLWFILFFFGPFLTLIGLEYNFFGFAGTVTEYYSVLYLYDPIVFIVWNILYWTAWININLAIFNCLPVSSIGLDGSRMLDDFSSIVFEKLGFGSLAPRIFVVLVNLLTLGGLLIIIAVSILN